MGAVGYAAQSGLFFLALARVDASLLALILYTYPAFVLVGAVALGREPATGRRVAALLVASAGIVLVLAVAVNGSVDGLGVAMGVGAALVYTGYILVGDRVVAGMPLLALAALVCTGATATFAGVTARSRWVRSVGSRHASNPSSMPPRPARRRPAWTVEFDGNRRSPLRGRSAGGRRIGPDRAPVHLGVHIADEDRERGRDPDRHRQHRLHVSDPVRR